VVDFTFHPTASHGKTTMGDVTVKFEPLPSTTK
jgi:hypothetical protein